MLANQLIFNNFHKDLLSRIMQFKISLSLIIKNSQNLRKLKNYLNTYTYTYIQKINICNIFITVNPLGTAFKVFRIVTCRRLKHPFCNLNKILTFTLFIRSMLDCYEEQNI